eukprot:CAMPEP_0115659048 /NCGR_PEP_ID=MMETSP0272-20121206/45523_1 /TAXON_ID=71861 /ORGANISM="Scrippsiella trochoidea, Strain CCMP3099" /LENGTH=324 /DNA_ID=CAMNT_0003097151 /DNA_START=29 /DNA_END=1000 /DNA_ORIENTATION=+
MAGAQRRRDRRLCLAALGLLIVFVVSCWRSLGRAFSFGDGSKTSARGATATLARRDVVATASGAALARRARNFGCALTAVSENFNYGEADYWDQRYEEDGRESSYDWLGDYEKFRPHIEAAAARIGGGRAVSVLDLGCGNARLAEDMHDDGYTNVTGVDISEVAISMMRERNAETRPGIKWVVGNAFELDFPDSSFDIVIDKSTMDALSCEAGKTNQNMVKLTGEVSRVLRTGGAYLVFSATNMGEASLHLPHLMFDVKHEDIPMPFSQLTVSTAVKQPGADARLLFGGKEKALEAAEHFDRQLAEGRRQREEAEKRLKETAPA